MNTEVETLNTEPFTIENKIFYNSLPPEDSRNFNERLRREFGELEGYPRYRVVWGQDERYKVWQAGKPRLRYVMLIQKYILESSYLVKTTKGDFKKFTPNQLRKYTPKPGELITPQETMQEKEIGFPFWYLEYYATPKMLGGREEWERHRWIQGVDLTGAYPENGRYEMLTELSGLDAEGNLTEYRPLNDETFQFVCAMVKGKKEAIEQARQQKAREFENLWEELFGDQMMKEVLDESNRKPIYFT